MAKDRKQGENSVCGPLFFEQPSELRERALKEAAYRLSHPLWTEQKLAREKREKEEQRPKFKTFELASGQMMEDCPGWATLDDGYWRVVLINRLGGLEILRSVRFSEPWIAQDCKEVGCLLGKQKWPLRGVARKFATPYLREGHIVRIDYDEEEGQYFFVLEDGPGVTRTFWFPPHYEKSPLGKGWARPTRLSMGDPWRPSISRKAGVKRYPDIRSALTEELKRAYEAGGGARTHAILALRHLFPSIPPRLLKEQVERIISSS